MEQLVFVANDTDLAPTLAAIREDFTQSVQIGVILPIRKATRGGPGNQSRSEQANWTRRYITSEELAGSQLPV